MANGREALHQPFYGHRGRAVAFGLAGLQALVQAAVVAALWPQLAWYDVVGFGFVTAAVGWLLIRLGLVAVFPAEDGVRVRNLLLSRRLEWAQIVGVRFGGGDPWVLLDLSDGDTLAVMAIQRADGAAGRAEADRLATLVALHSPRR